MTSNASTSSLTSSVNTKIHHISHSNVQDYHMSIFSMTVNLLTLQDYWHENVQIQWSYSLCFSTMNLYYHQRWMSYKCLRLHNYSKLISISASWTHSHSSLSLMHELTFRASLLIKLNVLITHLRSYISRLSVSRFKLSFRKVESKKSRISHSIISALQSSLFQSKWMIFKLNKELSLIFFLHEISSSMTTFLKNMTHLFTKLSTMRFNWLFRQIKILYW